MKKQTILGGVLCVFSFLLSGCEAVRSALQEMEKPQLRLADVRFESLSLDGVGLIFDVEVSNPYEVGLPLAAIDYDLQSEGGRILQGEAPRQTVIPAGGKEVVPLRTRVVFADLLRTISGIRPGKSLPYAADLGISLDLPAVGRQRLPLSHRGEIPVPTAPTVAIDRVRWDGAPGVLGAAGAVELEIDNPNDFELDVQRMEVAIQLAGVRIGDVGFRAPERIGSDGSRSVEIPFRLSAADVVRAGISMLVSDETGYGIVGGLDVQTPFGPLSFPLNGSGTTKASR